MINKIILSIGSNYDPMSNMDQAEIYLRDIFADIQFTRRIWTEPIGIDSDPFLNCMAMASTQDDFERIQGTLKQVEWQMGSTHQEHCRGLVKIDLDILLFGKRRYHDADWRRSYVSTLIGELPLP